MKRTLLILAAFLMTAPALWLLVFQFEPIWPNLAASYICTAPMFAATHLVLKRRDDRHHAAVHARLDAQDEAQAAHAAELAAHRADLAAHRQDLADHRRDLAAVAVKVDELHSVGVQQMVPKRLIRP